MSVVNVEVRVLSVDVGCDLCGSSLADIPPDLGARWAESHRDLARFTTDLEP